MIRILADALTTPAVLLEKVVIGENAVTIRVRLSALSGRADVPASSANNTDAPVELTAPLAFKRRGIEMRLVLSEAGMQNDRSRCDPTLIKAIARGRAWFEELAAGRPDRCANWPSATALPSLCPGPCHLAFLSPELRADVLIPPDYSPLSIRASAATPAKLTVPLKHITCVLQDQALAL